MRIKKVIGEGKPARYQALAKRLHVLDQVQFVPGRADLAPVYRSADLLIHPARTENTATTLMEAMLCGLPGVGDGELRFCVSRRAGTGWVVMSNAVSPRRVERVTTNDDH